MSKLDQSAVLSAAHCLRAGGLVAFATETVYGLGANARVGEAVAKIYEAKGRPRFNPLIVHVKDIAAVEALCDLPAPARALADAFWPGPLTLVLARKADCPVSDLVSAGLSTLAVRVPAHPVAQALLHEADVPIAAPSANRSGHVSATTATHVRADLGDRVDHILDGGPTRHGLESTIVAVGGTGERRGDEDVVVLRCGAIETQALENVLGSPLGRRVHGENSSVSSPGQLQSHYAPRARMRLNATSVLQGEALLAFGAQVPGHEGKTLNLSARGDVIEAAANLFFMLRELDGPGVTGIAVMAVPVAGLGEAINDRLVRAAAPRGELGDDPANG